MISLGGKKSFDIDKRTEKDYYLFIVDGPYTSDIGVKLSSYIEGSGITSYAIAIALQQEVWTQPVKGNITKWYVDHQSNWKKKYLEDKSHNCKGIFAFGRSLLQIINGNHVSIDDFAVIVGHNYFYLNHDYLGPYDTFIWPLYPVEESLVSGYQHNYFIDMLRKRDSAVAPNLTPINCIVPNSKEEATKILTDHYDDPFMSFDLETSGLNSVTDDIKCISFAFNIKDAYCVDWKDIDLEVLNECMRRKKKLITANGKFDILFLWNHGLDTKIEITDDVILLQHCFNSGIKKGLKPQSYYHTPFGGYNDALEIYKSETGVVDYSVIPFKVLAPYAAMDAGVTLRTYFVLMQMIVQFDKDFPSEKMAEFPEWCDPEINTLQSWYQKLAVPMLQVICRTQYKGAYLDMREYNASFDGLKKLEDELREKLKSEFNTPPDFKWTSGTEIVKLMKQNGLELEDTSKDTLMNLIYDNVEPRLKDLIEYRHVFKALYSYVGTENYTMNRKNGAVKDRSAGWAKFKVYHKDDDTYRIHPNYEVMGTETFRIISNNPNFQAIPAHGAYAKYIKKILACPPDTMWTFNTNKGEEKATRLDIVHLVDGTTKKPEEVVVGDDIDFIEKPYYNLSIYPIGHK